MIKDEIYCHIKEVSENDCQQAFKRLYLHFSPGLHTYAHSLLRNMPLAEEVVEDVFIKMWTNRKLLPAIDKISYYLYTAVKHTAINYLKSQKRNHFEDLEKAGNIFCNQDPEARAVQKETLQQIEAAFNALPEKCQLIFRLVKEEGLKYREVAELLFLSQKTVEAHMKKAYSRIADALEALLPEYTLTKKASGN